MPISGEFSEELHSLGQFIQDGSPILFESFLEIGDREISLPVPSDRVDDHFSYLDGKDFDDINRAAFEATRKAHSRTLPCFTIKVDRIDEYSFGELFYFFEFACYLSCRIMGVNPFDQNGVEDYKRMMFKSLGR